MKKISGLILISILLAGCSEKSETVKAAVPKEKGTPKKEFKMYEASEMAALMETMYADNMNLKQRIINGDSIGQFPQHFIKIHSSVMTDESENDAFFKEQAAKFIKAQEMIYKDPANAKTHFNDAVAACVQCHEQKCEGPIPRIKKLYIK